MSIDKWIVAIAAVMAPFIGGFFLLYVNRYKCQVVVGNLIVNDIVYSVVETDKSIKSTTVISNLIEVEIEKPTKFDVRNYSTEPSSSKQLQFSWGESINGNKTYFKQSSDEPRFERLISERPPARPIRIINRPDTRSATHLYDYFVEVSADRCMKKEIRFSLYAPPKKTSECQINVNELKINGISYSIAQLSNPIFMKVGEQVDFEITNLSTTIPVEKPIMVNWGYLNISKDISSQKQYLNNQDGNRFSTRITQSGPSKLFAEAISDGCQTGEVFFLLQGVKAQIDVPKNGGLIPREITTRGKIDGFQPNTMQAFLISYNLPLKTRDRKFAQATEIIPDNFGNWQQEVIYGSKGRGGAGYEHTSYIAIVPRGSVAAQILSANKLEEKKLRWEMFEPRRDELKEVVLVSEPVTVRRQ